MNPVTDDQQGSPVWTALVLTLPEAIGEELAGAVADHGPGAEFKSLDESRGELWIYLSAPGEQQSVADRAARLLESYGLSLEGCAPRVVSVAEQPWVERYQAGLRPFRIGRRFVVCPSDLEAAPRPDPGRRSIRLVPGRAFGTGEHPTTRLCVEQLESRVEPGSRWVDLGCGSGILGIVAVHCGAQRVLGLDLDEDAVEVATEVVAANALADRVELRQGGAELAGPGWDGVVANIESAYFLRAACEVTDLVKRGGIVIVSGLVEEQVEEVASCFLACGAEELQRRDLGQWWVLTFRRSATEASMQSSTAR